METEGPDFSFYSIGVPPPDESTWGKRSEQGRDDPQTPIDLVFAPRTVGQTLGTPPSHAL